MGYSTTFKGYLKFTKELNASEISDLTKFLGEDCRDHPEWGNTNLSYIDLRFLKDYSGLEWDGSEKTYDLPDKINLLINNMQKKFPDFNLEGQLLAQGESIGDVWVLKVENGIASENKIDLSNKKTVVCPHCKEQFVLDNILDK